MATVKRVYTDNELDEMCADEFFNTLGIDIYQEADEAYEEFINNPDELLSWNDHVAKYGMD